jgi:formylglycine-generating enzyme required for sulfatase activity
MRGLLWFVVTALGACGPGVLPPAGQLRVHVVTDAPVAGDPSSPALFDRAEIAIVTPDAKSACNDCTRTFALNHSALQEGVSFGVLPRPGRSDLVLRARMFLSRHGLLEGGGDAIVEVWTRLPAVSDEGIVDMTVRLAVANVGVPLGSVATPVEPTLGRPDRAFVGSFAGAKQRPCAGTSPQGAVCVPGGASWMGDPVFRDLARARQGGLRRIVVVRPFHLDETEVTVGAFRKSGSARANDPLRTGGIFPEKYCTYVDVSSPEADVLPVNCISRERALAFCQARGGKLPTEAQFAYVQGGLRGMRYVWGEDPPTCEDAAWARIRTADSGVAPDECAFLSARPGAQPVGHGRRDRLTLVGGTIVDLAGNVSELAMDDFEPDGETCWPRGVLVDPLCVSTGGGPVGRGGSCFSAAVDLRAGLRASLAIMNGVGNLRGVLPQFGFRCAYDDS